MSAAPAHPARTLGALLPHAGLEAGVSSTPVAGLSADSRAIKPGFVFFAVPGVKADGLAYAPAALEAGAVAIVSETPAPPDLALGHADFVPVADVRRELALAASRFSPNQPATIIAVTGTSGKTSVAAFTRQIWAALGHQAAALGTTGLVSPTGATYGSLTTPDPVSLHATLDRVAGEGVTHLALEASSHGLDQRRLDGVRLAAAAFTNLSRDHLDYHPTLDAYLQAKLRLFDTLLAPGQPAVIDADSEVAPKVIAACQARGLEVMTVGRQGADITLLDLVAEPAASRITLRHSGQTYGVHLPLAGGFMASNALVAAGLTIATGGDPTAVFAALGYLEGAPGRLEQVGTRNNAPIFVDYAHKPDALEKVLVALRPLATGRLVLVFGCGGDRDAGKRAIMGEIAQRLADVTIVTDDNPRSEDPALIRRAILAAHPGARGIGDRQAAIATAVEMLTAGDVLVVAGKGHETGQIVGATTLPFSDHAAIKMALAALGGDTP